MLGMLALAAGGVLYVLYRTERGESLAVDVLAGLDVSARPAPSSAPKGPSARRGPARGIRNNNPGNIDWIANPLKRWRGMIRKETPEEGGRFGVFDTPANGVRAIGKELELEARRGAVTVAQQIAVWAPSNENDTAAYARAVAKALQVRVDEPIDVRASLPEFVEAIIWHENGAQPYAPADVAKWVYA